MSVIESQQTEAGGNSPTVAITPELKISDGVADLWLGLLRYQQWWFFAWHEIRQRFRRSILGPFWITLSMGILVGALGFVFGAIFKSNISDFLPYLATGLIFWGLLTSVINDGASVFIWNAGNIRDIPMPLSVHFYQLMARSLIIWLHNMAIYLVILVVFARPLTLDYLWFFPGFVLFVLNLSWVGLAVGILSTRFRDIPQVIANIVQVVFFVTPIFWSIDLLPDRPAFVALNPAYHLLEVVRAPLLGQVVPIESWLICIGLAILGWLGTLWLFGRSHSRIAFWI